jgi:penicillin-binding protein 1B
MAKVSKTRGARRPRRRKAPSRRRRNLRKPRHARKALRWTLLGVLPAIALLISGYVAYLYLGVLPEFEGKRWALPATVYARSLELYRGLPLRAEDLVRELELLRYERGRAMSHPGTYSRDRNSFHLATRAFDFWDGHEPPRRIRLRIEEGKVVKLSDLGTGGPLDVLRLDPGRIGSFSTAHGEDRVLVRLEDVPPTLVQGLLAVEDRAFYEHAGVRPSAIARAFWANLRAGRTVQGGSTLTQQLVKNYFLSNERSLWRKINEAFIALLLELRYDKDEILQAYLNEVYLVQDQDRAIHGFGLASRFLFNQSLHDLALPQQALLIGIIKGPSYYDPRRHPERARERRDLVLDIMADQGVIDEQAAAAAKKAPLGISAHATRSDAVFPAFMDLVRRQLQREYRDEDLRSEGLRIFTTLDPRVQRQAEAAVDGRLAAIERSRGIAAGSLQAAVVVTRISSGEVLALVGDRDARFPGFNRALDALRPIGSLVKPAVYLTALSDGEDYTLASLIPDEPLRVEDERGEVWEPANYDGKTHGEVTIYEALVRSYNLATARLGLKLGIGEVAETLRRLGLRRPVRPFPSMLLGSTSHTPIEIAQVFQTLAGAGFQTPIRSILAVLDSDGQPLERFPLSVHQAIDPAPVYLINAALEGVVKIGTAHSADAFLPEGLQVAGKTGTTDELRDAWFAGYSGEHLAVVWVGRDDNAPMGLSGASGALPIWGTLFAQLDTRSLAPVRPGDVELAWIDLRDGRLSAPECENAVELPFLEGTVPTEVAECGPRGKKGIGKWFKRMFQ